MRPFTVMVLDDASPDGTGVVADALAAAHPGEVLVVHDVAEPAKRALTCDRLLHPVPECGIRLPRDEGGHVLPAIARARPVET